MTSNSMLNVRFGGKPNTVAAMMESFDDPKVALEALVVYYMARYAICHADAKKAIRKDVNVLD